MSPEISAVRSTASFGDGSWDSFSLPVNVASDPAPTTKRSPTVTTEVAAVEGTAVGGTPVGGNAVAGRVVAAETVFAAGALLQGRFYRMQPL